MNFERPHEENTKKDENIERKKGYDVMKILEDVIYRNGYTKEEFLKNKDYLGDEEEKFFEYVKDNFKSKIFNNLFYKVYSEVRSKIDDTIGKEIFERNIRDETFEKVKDAVSFYFALRLLGLTVDINIVKKKFGVSSEYMNKAEELFYNHIANVNIKDENSTGNIGLKDLIDKDFINEIENDYKNFIKEYFRKKVSREFDIIIKHIKENRLYNIDDKLKKDVTEKALDDIALFFVKMYIRKEISPHLKTSIIRYIEHLPIASVLRILYEQGYLIPVEEINKIVDYKHFSISSSYIRKWIDKLDLVRTISKEKKANNKTLLDKQFQNISDKEILEKLNIKDENIQQFFLDKKKEVEDKIQNAYPHISQLVEENPRVVRCLVFYFTFQALKYNFKEKNINVPSLDKLRDIFQVRHKNLYDTKKLIENLL